MSTPKADKSIRLSTNEPITRRRLHKVIRGLPEGEYAVSFTKKRNTASSGQRGYYWGYLLVEAGKLLNVDRETADRILCGRFLSSEINVAGENITLVRSSSSLDPIQSAEYYAGIRMWIWDKYRVRLMAPDSQLSKSKAAR